jgi:hypothetical protein
MNKIELALNQLDAEIIKNENDLSFKMPITTIDKGKIISLNSSLFLFLEEKPDTPETTPPIPKGMKLSEG